MRKLLTVLFENVPDDFIRERAEIAGLDLTDRDVAAIRRRWESDPFCTVDGLLAGLRMLRDSGSRTDRLAAWLKEAGKV